MKNAIELGANELRERLGAIVGDKHVFVDGAEVELRSEDIVPMSARCAAVVYPDSVEQVAALVELANELKMPLWPSSRGNNWGYGAAMALRPGALTMVLERMNRILEVDPELGYAVIEPGVTYRQLRQYLDEHHIDLWIDCTDSTADGSVIGNALDRGQGWTPYGDHFGNLCGMEVVLPTGRVCRPGMRPPGCNTEHTHNWGMGPYLDGMFSQSNLGVVTQAGIWLMPAPEHTAMFVLELDSDADLFRLIDTWRGLTLRNIHVSHGHIANHLSTLSVRQPYPYELREGTHIPQPAVDRYCSEQGIARWTAFGALYGSPDRVRVDWAEVEKAFGPLGTLSLYTDKDTADIPKNLQRVWDMVRGIPNPSFLRTAYFKGGRRDQGMQDPVREGGGLIWFDCIAPASGAAAERLVQIIAAEYDKHGFEFCGAFIPVNARTHILLTPIHYNSADQDEADRALQAYHAVAQATWAAGYAQNRAGLQGAEAFSDLEPGLKTLTGPIKAALDPNNILAPGRYGINAVHEGETR
ncbi:FAD-binding oxidoreductase [Nocardia sp. NPDC049149]|uniref:FAD-binding oxidoreductase n=1 Tax=Nocardia sp. NPDC049149 TaxID=3364315 RepID=UPI00371AEACB